jgi:hypothetical protein
METTLTSYHFNINHPEEAAAYKRLAARLRKTNGKCFNSWSPFSHYEAAWAEGVPVALETENLYGNQWDTAPDGATGGWRVFDWAEDCMRDRKIRRGHYLTITPEMVAVRKNVATAPGSIINEGA